MGHRDPARTGRFFGTTSARAEAEVEPDAVANDLGREAVVLVLVGRRYPHATNMAHEAAAGQATR